MSKPKNPTKTIKVGVYFWTNAGDKNKDNDIELPRRTCWDKGFVSVVSNNRHGIRSGIHSYFRGIDNIPNAIEDALKRSDVTIIQNKKGKQYKEALRKMKEAQL